MCLRKWWDAHQRGIGREGKVISAMTEIHLDFDSRLLRIHSMTSKIFRYLRTQASPRKSFRFPRPFLRSNEQHAYKKGLGM